MDVHSAKSFKTDFKVFACITARVILGEINKYDTNRYKVDA